MITDRTRKEINWHITKKLLLADGVMVVSGGTQSLGDLTFRIKTSHRL